MSAGISPALPFFTKQEKLMTAQITPLVLEDLTIGETYLKIEVWLDNRIVFVEFQLGERKDDGGILCYEGTIKCATGDYQTQFFACNDAGLIPEKRVNGHRVFRNTPEHRATLQSFDDNQDLKGYLEAIKPSLSKMERNQFFSFLGKFMRSIASDLA